jgi:hypothetical protein
MKNLKLKIQLVFLVSTFMLTSLAWGIFNPNSREAQVGAQWESLRLVTSKPGVYQIDVNNIWKNSLDCINNDILQCTWNGEPYDPNIHEALVIQECNQRLPQNINGYYCEPTGFLDLQEDGLPVHSEIRFWWSWGKYRAPDGGYYDRAGGACVCYVAFNAYIDGAKEDDILFYPSSGLDWPNADENEKSFYTVATSFFTKLWPQYGEASPYHVAYCYNSLSPEEHNNPFLNHPDSSGGDVCTKIFDNRAVIDLIAWAEKRECFGAVCSTIWGIPLSGEKKDCCCEITWINWNNHIKINVAHEMMNLSGWYMVDSYKPVTMYREFFELPIPTSIALKPGTQISLEHNWSQVNGVFAYATKKDVINDSQLQARRDHMQYVADQNYKYNFGGYTNSHYQSGCSQTMADTLHDVGQMTSCQGYNTTYVPACVMGDLAHSLFSDFYNFCSAISEVTDRTTDYCLAIPKEDFCSRLASAITYGFMDQDYIHSLDLWDSDLGAYLPRERDVVNVTSPADLWDRLLATPSDVCGPLNTGEIPEDCVAEVGERCTCPTPNAYCWCDTKYDNWCPVAWYDACDGCDQGCQFDDPDCQNPACSDFSESYGKPLQCGNLRIDPGETYENCFHDFGGGGGCACNDGQYCNGTETCDPILGCQSGSAPSCDDGIACTIDSCDSVVNDCVHFGDNASCYDNNPCTVDVCDPDSGCQNTRTTACCTPISSSFGGTGENYSGLDDYQSCNINNGGKDVCYSWTPTTSGTYVLDTCHEREDFDTILAIRDESGNTELACNDDDCGSNGLQSRIAFDAVAGTTYTIVVDAFSEHEQGYFDLNICQDIPPSGTFSGSTTAETDAFPSSCADDGGRDVCYWWTPPWTGTYVFDTCDSGTNFDTILTVFSGDDGVYDLACNDNFNGDPCSELNFFAQAGRNYRLLVDGYDASAHGDFVLKITEPECRVISAAGTFWGSTTTEPDNFGSSCADDLGRDVCYLWTPTLSGTYVFDTCDSGTNFDTILTVFSEDDRINDLACNDNFNGDSCSELSFFAQAGTTYRLLVDGYDGNAHGDFVLKITEPECPAISATGTFSGSTTTEPDNFGSSCADDGGRDVCYLWTPTLTWTYEISTCNGGTNFNSIVTVFSEDDGIHDLTCNDNFNGDPCSELNFNAEAGVSYRIVVDGYDGSAYGDFDLSITDVGGPACGDGSCNGDETCFSCEHDCGSCCTEIISGSSVSGSTTAATDDYSSGCGSDLGRDVCYAWTPTVSGIYELDTCGAETDFDTVLSIRAATLSSPEITCNNDGCTNRQSKLSFNAHAGATYWIVVDGYQDEDFGNFVLNLSDVLCTAIDDASGTITGDNISETDDYVSCNRDSGGQDICYAWTPRVSGPYMLNTCNGGTDFDTVLSVRDFGGKNEIACNDDYCEEYQSTITFEAKAYKTYRIVVDGYRDSDYGNFTLDIIQGGCSSAADCNDFNACTTDSCDSGICSNTGIAHTCNDGNPCTEDFCDWFFGCLGNPVMDGTPCSDGDACNGFETCQAGVCTEGSMLDCDDDNECTDDYCDTFSGCMNVAVACDDGLECTLDSCDPLLGCQNILTTDCCTPISGAVSVAGTILSDANGGVDYYVSCNINYGGADVCYSWTPTVSGSHVFDTCDTADLDTILSI